MRVSRGAASMVIEHASEIVRQMYDENTCFEANDISGSRICLIKIEYYSRQVLSFFSLFWFPHF